MDSSRIPIELLARRRVATVVVDGIGALGLKLAEELTHVGLGLLILRDDAPVAERDRGFRSVDQGRPRAEAAAEFIGGRARQTAVVEAPSEASVSGADLHIVTGRALCTDLLRRAVGESPAVLPLAASQAGWQVGPLLFGDAPLCVGCLELSGISVPAQQSGGFVSPALLHSAAAVTAHHVEVLVDGVQRCLIEQAALVADASTGRIAPVTVTPQESCTCITRVSAVTEPGACHAVGL